MLEKYYVEFKESSKFQFFVKKHDAQISSSKKIVGKECTSNLENNVSSEQVGNNSIENENNVNENSTEVMGKNGREDKSNDNNNSTEEMEESERYDKDNDNNNYTTFNKINDNIKNMVK